MVRGVRKDTGELLESAHVQLFDGVGWAEVELDTVDGRPHGRWVCPDFEFSDYWKCSACGEEFYFEEHPNEVDYNYCTHCGADMRGE